MYMRVCIHGCEPRFCLEESLLKNPFFLVHETLSFFTRKNPKIPIKFWPTSSTISTPERLQTIMGQDFQSQQWSFYQLARVCLKMKSSHQNYEPVWCSIQSINHFQKKQKQILKASLSLDLTPCHDWNKRLQPRNDLGSIHTIEGTPRSHRCHHLGRAFGGGHGEGTWMMKLETNIWHSGKPGDVTTSTLRWVYPSFPATQSPPGWH